MIIEMQGDASPAPAERHELDLMSLLRSSSNDLGLISYTFDAALQLERTSNRFGKFYLVIWD